MSKVLVFAEIRGGVFKGVNAELVSAGTALAGDAAEVGIAVLGSDVSGFAQEAAALGAGKVYTVEHEALGTYSTQGYAAALEAVIASAGPSVVLFAATAAGKDLSARLAARLDAALFTDCTELSLDGDTLEVVRPVYSGKVYAEAVSDAPLKMVSIRPNTFPPAAGNGTSEVVAVDATIDAGAIRSRVTEFVAAGAGGKDITESEIVVAGGRALKSAENFAILQELADVLGGGVGASRAAVDAGYAPHAIQVGQTGKVVNPKLYFAVGISGAIQHLVGMRTSKVIVAVNKDENAPIFQKADYGIVGDLFEVVPKITEACREALG